MRRRDNINWDSGKIEEIDPEDENITDEEFMARLEKKMFEDDYSSGEEDDTDIDKSKHFLKDKVKLKSSTPLGSGLTPEEIETIKKMAESNSCCPPIEIILLFCIIFLSVFSFSMIPGFIRLDIYSNLTIKQQPICAPIDKSIPGLSKYTIPMVISLFSFFLVKAKDTDLLVATFSSLILSFDTNFTGIMGQSSSTSLMAFLILLSYNIEHNILSKRKVYGFSWLFNSLISWFFASFLLLFRPETVGSICGLYACFFISGISEVCGALGNKSKMIFQTLKLIFFTYLIGIPLALLLLHMRSQYGQVQYNKANFNFNNYVYEYLHHNEPWYTYAYIILCFMFILNGKYTYKSIVPLIQSIISIIATLFVPYESPGNTYATKLFFIKLHLMLGASIIIGNAKIKQVRYAIPIIFFVISGFYKMGDIIHSVLESTGEDHSFSHVL